MKKKAKLFWRYFGPVLVLAEISVYFLTIQHSFPWQLLRIAFLLTNALIIAYLVQIKLDVEKHNAAIDAAAAATKAPQVPVSEIARQAEPATSSFAYTLT